MKWIPALALIIPATTYAFGNSPLNTFWDDVIGLYSLLFITILIGLAVRRWWHGPEPKKPRRDWLAGFKERKRLREINERPDRNAD